MIRKFANCDLDSVMKIWLDSNIQAHDFIAQKYWLDNFDMVKEILPKSEVWVYEESGEIVGFVGVDDEYIAGVFVTDEFRSRGIGKKLIDYIKDCKNSLRLCVYKNNVKAYQFYLRENFVALNEQIDENTGELECEMIWQS